MKGSIQPMEHALDGKIIAFDDETQEGFVATRDGRRYPFSLTDWRGRGLPGPETAVRFDVREARAVQVFNRPEKQRRATRKASVSDRVSAVREPANGNAQPRRNAHWAIAAIVVAMLGLFFDTLAPLLGLAASLLALLGLRQIRRAPQRYKGRGFCWAAIVLALAVATLSLLVEPASASRVSHLQQTIVPGSSRTG